MPRDLTTLEVIGLAIRSEEEAARFYGEVAKMIKNAVVRAKYEALAKEEAGHRLLLTQLYKKMTGESTVPPPIPGQPATAEGGMPPIGPESLEGLLKVAIGREQKACEFYRSAAERTNDNNAKSVFWHLSEIERGHEKLLKSELEEYLKNRDWYADKPDVQLVGP